MGKVFVSWADRVWVVAMTESVAKPMSMIRASEQRLSWRGSRRWTRDETWQACLERRVFIGSSPAAFNRLRKKNLFDSRKFHPAAKVLLTDFWLSIRIN
jgi:hypothetical protein